MRPRRLPPRVGSGGLLANGGLLRVRLAPWTRDSFGLRNCSRIALPLPAGGLTATRDFPGISAVFGVSHMVEYTFVL